MLNDNKWVRTNYGDSILYTADNKEIAKILSYGDGYYKLILWLSNQHLDFVLESDSMEIAEWQAGLIIYRECNRIANRMHYIRDHLPSSHEMYKKAYPEENMVPESTKEVLNDFGVYSNLKYIGAFSKIPDTSSIGNICTVDNITYVHDGKKWHVIGKVWFGKEDEWDTLPVEERIQYDVVINLDYFKKFSYDEPLPRGIDE